MFTPEEEQQLKKNLIYQKYASTAFSAITTANLLTDINAITGARIEDIPLIKWLTFLYQQKTKVDIDADINTITNTYLQPMYRAWGVLLGPPSNAHIHDRTYRVDMAQATLSSGSSSNLQLRAASAGYTISLAWFILWYDTAPSTSYTIDIHEESGSDIEELHVYPAECGKVFWTYLDTTTDNKKLECDIAGGAGTEVVGIISNTCIFT